MKEKLRHDMIINALALYKSKQSSETIIKQATEELYKIEDLQNSKCFIINKLKVDEHNVILDSKDVFDLINSHLTQVDMNPICRNIDRNNKYIVKLRKDTTSQSFRIAWFVNLFIDILKGRGEYIDAEERKAMRKAIRELKEYKQTQ